MWLLSPFLIECGRQTGILSQQYRTLTVNMQCKLDFYLEVTTKNTPIFTINGFQTLKT